MSCTRVRHSYHRRRAIGRTGNKEATNETARLRRNTALGREFLLRLCPVRVFATPKSGDSLRRDGDHRDRQRTRSRRVTMTGYHQPMAAETYRVVRGCPGWGRDTKSTQSGVLPRKTRFQRYGCPTPPGHTPGRQYQSVSDSTCDFSGGRQGCPGCPGGSTTHRTRRRTHTYAHTRRAIIAWTPRTPGTRGVVKPGNWYKIASTRWIGVPGVPQGGSGHPRTRRPNRRGETA